jgi:uncharacterized membrane protein
MLWLFIYSLFGWCYETIVCSIQAGKLVKRGFLFGPYLPIYGFGALFIVLFLHKCMNKANLFLLSMLVTTALEYATSWVLEILFNRRWWDYTNYSVQLNGRICLLASLLFGTLGVLLIKHIHPRLKYQTNRIPKKIRVICASFLFVGMSSDFIFSILRNLYL